MYASGTAGGIINIVDGAIAKSDITDSNLRISAETQTVNDGSSGSLSYSGNISGLNLTYSFKDENFGDYNIPSGAVVHSEEEHDEHEGEEDHDEHEEEEHHDEELGYLENSDYERESHKFGFSVVEDWGYIGASANILETHYGIPYHGDCLLYTSPSPRDRG